MLRFWFFWFSKEKQKIHCVWVWNRPRELKLVFSSLTRCLVSFFPQREKKRNLPHQVVIGRKQKSPFVPSPTNLKPHRYQDLSQLRAFLTNTFGFPREAKGERKRVVMTLKQTCSWEYPRAQVAFKDSMIHWFLQFTLRIAACCVLHRCTSQEIHR